MNTTTTPDFMTVRQAAVLAGVSPGRIRQMICWGQLHTTRFGYEHLIERSELARAVSEYCRRGRRLTDEP